MTLKEVGIVIGKDLMIADRVSPIRVTFSDTEIKGKSMLIGAYGSGHTVWQAKAQYCKKLGGELIVVDAMKPTRKEFQLPPKITPR